MENAFHKTFDFGKSTPEIEELSKLYFFAGPPPPALLPPNLQPDERQVSELLSKTNENPALGKLCSTFKDSIQKQHLQTATAATTTITAAAAAAAARLTLFDAFSLTWSTKVLGYWRTDQLSVGSVKSADEETTKQ